MHFPRFLMIFVFTWITLLACDDGDKRTPAQPSFSLSTITVGPVKYQIDPKGLGSEVVVHIVDASGAPLPGVAVHLESDLDHYSTVSPDSQLTDAAGDAVFSVVSSWISGANLYAHVSLDPETVFEAPTLDATALVNFDFEVSATPLDAAFAWNQGDFTVRLSLEDPSGAISEADINVMTDEADLLFDGSPINTYTTNTSGMVTLHATTPRTGLQEFQVKLDGVEQGKPITIDFYGPRVSGTVYLGQSYPLGFRSARVAAMGLSLTDPVTIDLGAPIRSQITSESVCPCPSPAGFELNLPITLDPDLLDADAARQVKSGYFPIVVYDDLNDDYLWNEGEPLLGARLSAGVLHFSMPDGDSPVGSLGWKLVDTIAEAPEELDWDFFRESLDAYVRRSPVTELHLSGSDDSGTPDGRVALYAVNATAMPGYTPSEAWFTSSFEALAANPDQLLLLADVPISSGTYDATVLAPAFSGTQAQDWEISWASSHGGTVKGYLIVPFVYADSNQNGAFDSGETVAGTVASETGTTQVIFYVTEYPNYDLFRNSTEPDIHLGYNLIRIGSVLEILARETNAGSQVFSFGVNLPAPWNNVPFQIVAAGSPLSTPPISAGTFSTFSVGNTIDIPSSTCTNCANSSPGDRFIILAPLDLVTRIYMDWTGLDFTAGRP